MLGAVAALVDVTARQAQAEALRDNQARLRLLLDSMGEGFYSIDRDGITTLCNATFRRMLGFEREEDAIGRKLHDVIHHSHPDGSHYAVEDCPIYRIGAERGAGACGGRAVLPGGRDELSRSSTGCSRSVLAGWCRGRCARSWT